MARVGAKGWAAIGLGAALVLGVGIAANAANHPAAEDAAATSSTSSASASPSATPSPTPSVEVRTETADEVIPFAATNADDPGHDVGWSAVTTAGANGVKTKTYRVTYVDGVETSRELVSEAVTTAPVDQVTSVGSRQPAPPPPPAPAPAPAPAPGGGCDPNYAGACVPIASDVDCAGGSGNGPAYVQGPVTVVGSDIYDLDRDGDGTGCDG
ncbi:MULTISPECIES: G5 domain-containing protein [unclassified Leifsonia]|uniref:G5 domain-containing protein n=1 Tax=unclassified Leifsonia TaxID=2663824 RepID=UPI00037872B1|nr:MULTISPECIES: G5 domain-containing protein [unclassified Leifsonia]TDP99386.1 surface rod structure-forming protein G [Leifsonia sp. 115AMFTsu3.1]